MRIPVIVLSGFLGSGKTTLLLRLLKETQARGLKPGILMNELGKQDVDGLILEEHSDTAVEKLLDGCVCCSKKGELAGAMMTLLDGKPDLIVIELTGVADPEEIADTLTDPGLLGKVVLRHIVTVLDAEHVLDYNSIFASDKQLVRTLRRQIDAADTIAINKKDLVNSSKLAKIEKMIRKQNERATIVYATRSIFDYSPLFDGIVPHDGKTKAAIGPFRALRMSNASNPRGGTRIAKRSDDDASEENDITVGSNVNRSYSRLGTVTLLWRPDGPVARHEVERFLKGWQDRLLRAKGYVTLGPGDPIFLLQFAGKRITWEHARYDGDPYLVFIGIDLDEQRLTSEFEQFMGDRN